MNRVHCHRITTLAPACLGGSLRQAHGLTLLTVPDALTLLGVPPVRRGSGTLSVSRSVSKVERSEAERRTLSQVEA
jgi:hypothetical protein